MNKENLSSRINTLLTTTMRGQGWCTPEKGNDLALAVLKTRAQVVVEIGVFYGSSLLPMAMACDAQQQGVVWAIDPWEKAAASEGYDKVNADWWSSVDHESVYQTFLAHLKAQGVEKYVKVVRAKSNDVEPPENISVLHIDGLHTDQAVLDAERFATNVALNGFCFCDDITWSSGGPARAVEKLLAMGFTKLFERGTGAMFQRTSMGARKAGWPKGKKRGTKNKK
jgi:hypothetical protein